MEQSIIEKLKEQKKRREETYRRIQENRKEKYAMIRKFGLHHMYADIASKWRKSDFEKLINELKKGVKIEE